MSGSYRVKRIKGRFYDTGTKNASFLQLAKDLKSLGVKNWYFMLEIMDYSLVNVDPFACDENGHTTLSNDIITRIVAECRRNPWYYLREICRIEDQGNPNGIPYKANRGNIAQTWLILHGIDSWLCLPRQQGKTQSALAIQAWAYSFGTTNSTFIFINKDEGNAKENLRRLQGQIDLLPEYLRFESILNEEDGKRTKARKSATTMEHPITKNKIITKPKATSYDGALSIARGLTAPLLHFDEPEFTKHISTIVANSVSTYETAARNAENNGAMHARIFTCTPGDLDTDMGVEASVLLDKCCIWTEKFYDMTKEEMIEYIDKSKEDCNKIVYIEFQYYQIGLTREWLDNISKRIGDMLVVRREILLQRLHGSSDFPYLLEDLEYIQDNKRLPIDEIYIMDFYKFDIYEELEKDIPYIVGIDCSTGTNGDNNAITILNPYTVTPVAEFECAFVGETMYEKIIIELVQQYIPKAIVCIERNSIGDGIVDHLLVSPIANRLYFDRNKDLVEEKNKEMSTIESMLKKQASYKSFYGVYTSPHSREQMFAILSNHVNEYKDKFVTQNIIRDFSRLVKTKSGKIAAGPGFHDDSIMSYLISLYVYYHGNNLAAFGFIKGQDPNFKPNQGLYRSREELEEVLPRGVVDSIEKEKEFKKLNDYEAILAKAIMESQNETRKILNSSNIHMENDFFEERDVYDDDTSSIPLDFFDSINF